MQASSTVHMSNLPVFSPKETIRLQVWIHNQKCTQMSTKKPSIGQVDNKMAACISFFRTCTQVTFFTLKLQLASQALKLQLASQALKQLSSNVIFK